MIDRSTLFVVIAAALALIGLAAFALGELLFAGLCMLGTSFAIYLHETRG